MCANWHMKCYVERFANYVTTKLFVTSLLNGIPVAFRRRKMFSKMTLAQRKKSHILWRTCSVVSSRIEDYGSDRITMKWNVESTGSPRYFRVCYLPFWLFWGYLIETLICHPRLTLVICGDLTWIFTKKSCQHSAPLFSTVLLFNRYFENTKITRTNLTYVREHGCGWVKGNVVNNFSL